MIYIHTRHWRLLWKFFTKSCLEFVTGETGSHTTRAPGTYPHPGPLSGLGPDVYFGIPSPCPRSGARPTHTPDGSLLKIGGNKWGTVQGMKAGRPCWNAFVYFLCIFNTLPCIALLSLCFGSASPLLTLLHLRYILWCFIVYFRIISRDLTCAFQSGVWDFMVVYASLMHHSWSWYF